MVEDREHIEVDMMISSRVDAVVRLLCEKWVLF
jgi:hypothetical protein